MRIKSYFTGSVQEAIERARQELGPEAMLIHSKNTEPELQNLGRYEVVFGISAALPKLTDTKAPEAAAPAADPLLNELADLRREMETIRRSLARQSKMPGTRRFAPELEELSIRLERAGLSPEIAEEIVASIETSSGSGGERLFRGLHDVKRGLSPDGLDGAAAEEIERRLKVSSELGSSDGNRVVMLVGPPGSGKTTTLIKLALQYGLQARTPVEIFTTDTFRVGAAEQLGRYAAIAGIAFQNFQNVSTLAAALTQRAKGRLILIDTQGYSAGEMSEATDWARFAARNRIDVHLVLPATMRTSIAIETAGRFKLFGDSKLILTHWDELDSAGAAFELAARSGLPLSFIGSGQQIPDDLREPSAADLAQQIVPRRRSAAVSGA